jgi:hypothetical protein
MLLLVAAALIAAPQPSRPQLQSKPSECPRTTSYYAWQRGKPVKPQKLTELPDANAYSAVYRRIAGCEVPIVVKYGVSGR